MAEEVEAPKEEISDWRSALPEDMQNNESLSKFSNVEALAGSYINAEKMIGKDTLTIPTTDDEWEKVYSQLGRPEEASKYELQTPENMPKDFSIDPEMQDAFKAKAFEAGLNQKQIESLNSWYWETSGKMYQDLTDGATKAEEKASEELKKSWGERYDVNLTMAQRALDKFGDENFAQYLDDSGLGNNPSLIKFMYEVAQSSLDEGDINSMGNEAARQMDPAAIREEINGIMQQPAYMNNQDPNHGILVSKVQKLFERMHVA